MQINVAHLLKTTAGAARDYTLEAGDVLTLDDERTLTISGGQVHLCRTNRGIIARGAVTGIVDLECSRCLDPLQLVMEIPIDEEYMPSVDIIHGTPLPPPDDDLAFTISEGHLLDLSEAVRQNTLTRLPTQPLCRLECAGLCPQCGINLNTQSCTCTEDGMYHPLAHLRDLIAEVPG